MAIGEKRNNNKIEETLFHIDTLSYAASDALQEKFDFIYGEEGEKISRHYNQADLVESLNISKSTINKYCDLLGIDYKRFEGIAWQININDLYALQDYVAELKGVSHEFKRLPGQLPITVPVANQKGGTGKTSTAATLASCLAVDPRFKRLKILLVDHDFQNTLSMYYVDKNKLASSEFLTFSQVLLEEYELSPGQTVEDVARGLVLDTVIPNMKLIPMIDADRSFEVRLHEKMAKSSDFKNPYCLLDDVLSRVKNDFDIIIIDTPPSMSYAMSNALYAGDKVLIPLMPSENDLQSTFSWLKSLPTIMSTLEMFGFNGYEAPPKIIMTNHSGQATAFDNQATLQDYFADYMSGQYYSKSEAIQVCSRSFSTIHDISTTQYNKTKKTLTKAVLNSAGVANEFFNDCKAIWKKQRDQFLEDNS